jgi:sugar phosphate isomerase/epimerase
MMTLAFSTNAYTKFTLPEACDRIAAAGYRAVEVLADVPHAYPPTYEAHRAERLKERLETLGLRCVAVNANTAMGWFDPVPAALTFEPSLVSPDARRRGARVEIIQAALGLAARLGAPVVTLTTGQPDPSARPDQMREWLLDGLDLVVEAAHRAGVELAIECEPGQFIERSADLKVLLDEVGDPRLGANLDIGHAVCLGEDPAESVRLLAPHLKHLHLEDIKGRRHWHLIPGEGDIDFASVAKALREVGYGRAAAVELYTYKDEPDRAARAAFAALAPLFGAARTG